MKMLLVILIIPIVVIGVVYGVGLFLPVQRTATRTVILPASLDTVFELVTDNSKTMQWRTDLNDLRVLDNTEKEEQWIEYPKKGNPITFMARVKEPPLLYEITMTDNKIFKGYWRGSFEYHQDGTKVTFTEFATITNPFHRILSFLFYDLGKTIDQYVTLLSNALDKQQAFH